jgi:uncharacterized membrane protein YgdD (TMEM256/DUF423 family)
MNRLLTTLTAVLAFTGVAFGALGAHALKSAVGALPDAAERLAWWDTAAKYHLSHALALGLLAVLAVHVPGRLTRSAAACFVTGIALFSGSLYGLALTGTRALGIITPFGGLAFLAGWLLVGIAAQRLPRSP